MSSSDRRRRPSSGRTRPEQPSSSRPKFVSYHASRQQYEARQPLARQSRQQEESLRPGRKKRFPGSWLTWAVGLILVICSLYSLSLSTHPRFTMTNPSGVPMLRSAEQYEAELSTLLGQSLLNQNKLTINTAQLKQQFKARFPEVNSVEVMLPFMGRRPVIEATTSRPALYLQTIDASYLIDHEGRALLAVTDLPPNAQSLNIPTVVDKTELNVKAGQNMLAAQDVLFITTLSHQFNSKELTISSMELPPLAAELHVRLSDTPYYIKFNLLTDPRVAVGQYFALRQELESKGVMPKEYIDSRVEEKIYYR